MNLSPLQDLAHVAASPRGPSPARERDSFRWKFFEQFKFKAIFEQIQFKAIFEQFQLKEIFEKLKFKEISVQSNF